MRKEVSTYLDLLRVIAALEVFLAHSSLAKFGGSPSIFSPFAHQAVVVFFVISGYVIAHVTRERETDFASYAISRASRIYSVAIPALIVTVAVDKLLLSQGSDPGDAYQLAKPWIYVPLFLLFGTDWWALSENAFSNTPYWSLSYECWYYVLFAAWIFSRGRRRVVLCGAVLLLVGPRSWLLLPLWLSGVWLYRLHRGPAWPRGPARVLWAASLVALACLLLSPAYAYLCDVPYLGLGPAARGLLRYSQYFLGDYVLGGLIAMNIAALPSCGFRFGRMSGSIRYVAALSFALYLFHYPLLELFSPWLAPLPLAVAVLAAVWVLGIATEALRAVLRSQASAAVARAQRRREAPSLPRPQRV